MRRCQTGRRSAGRCDGCSATSRCSSTRRATPACWGRRSPPPVRAEIRPMTTRCARTCDGKGSYPCSTATPSSGSEAPMSSDVEQFLASHSVPADRIDEAGDGGWLPLLLLDQTLFPGPARFGAEEVAAEAGVDPDVARTLWRAMGFSESNDGGPAYYPED